jgi:release factor glutamine methyltransferase
MNMRDSITWGRQFLTENNVEGPESSALLLLSFILGKSKEYIIANPDSQLRKEDIARYREFIKRRANHEPVWYITGKIDFFGQEFAVNDSVLIPRPETELLIEKIIERVRGGFSPKNIVDIGTGSGAIILTLADNFKNISGVACFASDISEKAILVAKSNAENLGFGSIVEFRQGNLFDPWKDRKFDLIVANLPYVPDGDELAPDLVKYEPQLALFGGEDGLDIIRELIRELPKYLADGGKVFLEIGYDQGERVQQMVKDSLPDAKVEVIGDYANIDRIVIIET